MDDLVKKIKKAGKVVEALTQLALSIGTLVAVIKMVIESLMQEKKGRNPLIPLRFYHRSILNTTMLKELFKLIVSIIVFICTVIGLFLLFIHQHIAALSAIRGERKKEVNNYKISLAAARVNAGMTQNDIAKKMHISKNTVINWEKGKVELKPAQFKMYCEIVKAPEDAISLPTI